MSKHLKSLLFRAAQLGHRLATLEQDSRAHPLAMLRLKSAHQAAIERVRRVADSLVHARHQRAIR